jgi:hypothetical protein
MGARRCGGSKTTARRGSVPEIVRAFFTPL